MKLSFPSLSILVFILSFATKQLGRAQNGLSWSPPVSVASVSFGSANPRFALLPGGVPVAVWGKATTTPKIWCARWDGSAFTTPVEVNTGGLLPGLYDFAGIDVATAGQKVFVVFEKTDSGPGIFLVRSDDGGDTWQDPDTVFIAPSDMLVTISAIAVDGAGNPMVSFLLQTSTETNAHVHLARSIDGGLTFPTSTNASFPVDGGQACECCYQDILPLGGDTVFVAFRANRSNLRDMWITRSTDGGETFDTACDIDAQDWVVNACPFSGPQMARLAGDSLLAVWMSKGNGMVRVYASTLHGGTMAKGQEFGFPGSSGVPAIAYSQNHPDVAGQRDTVAVVWEESGFAGTGQDILCAFSTTGAAGLSGNLGNITAATGAQKFPQLRYVDGVFHLVYVNSTAGLAYRRGTVVAPSAVDKVSLTKNKVRLLPNPAGDFLFIESVTPPGAVEILTLAGQVVHVAAVQGGRLKIADLPAGIYFLKIKGNKDEIIDFQRFVKQ